MDLVFPANARYSYPTANRGIGIEIPVTLFVSTDRSVRLQSKLDTGASFCIFQREYAEQLGLEVESGIPMTLETVTGSFQAFGHSLRLQCFGHEIESVVYFAATLNFPRNVLGRTGWLDRFRLGLVDYESALYLSPYNE